MPDPQQCAAQIDRAMAKQNYGYAAFLEERCRLFHRHPVEGDE